MSRYLAFSLGTEAFLIDANIIHEVLTEQVCTALPHGKPDWLLTSHHGQLLDVFDLSFSLQLRSQTTNTLRGDVLLLSGYGLLVERVVGFVEAENFTSVSNSPFSAIDRSTDIAGTQHWLITPSVLDQHLSDT
jgi:chemotaxis signal transduction protein